jgi:hypothetical protein
MTLTLNPGWDYGETPDATSTIVVVDAATETTAQIDPSNLGSGGLLGTFPLPSYAPHVMRVEAYYAASIVSLEKVPFREAYAWPLQNGRLVIATSAFTTDSQRSTDGTLLFDTTAVPVPTATTLTADLTASTDTSISVASGTNLLVGTYVQIGTEILYLVAGSGTAYTVQRAQLGTTAPTSTPSHASGASVIMGGAFTFSLAPISQVFNQDLVLSKVVPASYTGVASDLNYVKILPASGNQLPDGASYLVLPDNSSARGTYSMSAPGA